jgi:hypothetical protein
MGIQHGLSNALRACCCAIMAIVLLVGCATKGQDVSGGKSGVSGALMVVRIVGRQQPVKAVALDVLVDGQADGISFTAKVQGGIPGRPADYLLALALPPGQYVLKELRDATLVASDPAAKLATLDIPIQIEKKDPVYLGRLVLPVGGSSVGRADVTVEDNLEQDVLDFKTEFAQLREAVVDRKLILPQTVIVSPSVAANPARRMQVDVANSESAALLNPAARAAFAQFMRLAAPKAFATSPKGASGYASGRDAIGSALRKCVKQAKGEDCRLFAVDDTLITEASCKATMTGNGTAVMAGCSGNTKTK